MGGVKIIDCRECLLEAGWARDGLLDASQPILDFSLVQILLMFFLSFARGWNIWSF